MVVVAVVVVVVVEQRRGVEPTEKTKGERQLEDALKEPSP